MNRLPLWITVALICTGGLSAACNTISPSSDECSGDGDCQDRQRCREGFCQYVQCTLSLHCSAGWSCVDDVCRSNGRCTTHQECGGSTPFCDIGSGACVATTCQANTCDPDAGCLGGCARCGDGGCPDGSSSCQGHDHLSCKDGNLWWFDSCGQPESLHTACTSGCANSQCQQCTPDCTGRTCGLDPVCGQSCGQCPFGPCNPDGTCQTCTSHHSLGCKDGDAWWFDSCDHAEERAVDCPGECVNGQCANCTPNCGDRRCGPDPVCARSCGTCPSDQSCSPTGQCGAFCELGGSRCSEDGFGFETCGPTTSGETTFGDRIPCKAGDRCHATTGRCVVGSCLSAEVMLVLDRSSSMTESGAWSWVKTRLVESMDVREDYNFLGFRQFPLDGSCTVGPVLPLDKGNADDIQSEIQDPDLSSATPIGQALNGLANVYGDPNDGQAVVLVTDGDETCGNREEAVQAASALWRAGVRVYVLAVTTTANRTFLNRLGQAGGTGGSRLVTTADEFTAAMDAIYADLGACQCSSSDNECITSTSLRTCSADRKTFAPVPCPDSDPHGEPLCLSDACSYRCDSNYKLCGTACKACPTDPNASSYTCQNNACVSGTCRANFHLCSGVCADNTSPQTCGSRCEPCPTPTNARATCVSGACGTECLDGFRMCGGACASCPAVPHASPFGCQGTACVVTGCENGFHLCGQECRDNTSVNSCGNLCQPCPTAPLGTAVCQAGACAIQCNPGYLWCGGSCTPCPSGSPIGSYTCNGNACVIDQCNLGYHACGQECVDNSSVNTCGSRCEPCPGAPHGTAECRNNACTLTCTAPFTRCGTRCALPDDCTAVAAYSFEETSGPVLDSSAHENHGAVYAPDNVQRGVPGKVDLGILIKPEGGVSIPRSTSLDPVLKTVSFWIKEEDADATHAILYHGPSSSSGYQPVTSIFMSTGILTGRLFAPDGWGDVKTPGRLAANTWYHVALSNSGGTVRLYLDGILVDSMGGLGLAPVNGHISLGGMGTTGGRGFTLDEVKLHGYEQSAATICAAAGRTWSNGACVAR